MADEPQGCGRISGAVAPQPGSAREAAPHDTHSGGREATMAVCVGQKAPEFTAPAYYRGGFTTVKLADYVGKWVLLCFYPGDFTFV